MKWLSGEAVMTLSVGSTFLLVLAVTLMEVLLTVPMIMLAKAMTMVVIIPMEIIPPVNVLYSVSF
jgi:hypothetical protein